VQFHIGSIWTARNFPRRNLNENLGAAKYIGSDDDARISKSDSPFVIPHFVSPTGAKRKRHQVSETEVGVIGHEFFQLHSTDSQKLGPGLCHLGEVVCPLGIGSESVVHGERMLRDERRRPWLIRKERDAARHRGLTNAYRYVDEIDDFPGCRVNRRGQVKLRPSVVMLCDCAENDLSSRMSRKRNISLHNGPREARMIGLRDQMNAVAIITDDHGYWMRAMYLRSRVSMRILSPGLMNSGTVISAPVSNFAGFCTLFAVSPRNPGSVSVTSSSM
jgi:hypothetical protein